MKKIFSLLAAVLFAGSMMAGKTTLTFKDNGGSRDGSTKLTKIADIVAGDDAYYVSAVSATEVYNAREGRGIKLGTGSNTGSLELTLVDFVEATSIVVKARAYGDTETTLFIQDKNDYALTTAVAEYTYTYATATRINKISLGTVEKRNYIISVTINYEGEDLTPVIPEPAVNLGAKTIAEFLELKNDKDTCVLTGVVDTIVNDTYGNLYLADKTDTLYVYGVLTPAGESKKFADLNVAQNDTLTVKAVYGEYNGKPQASNVVFVSVKKAPVAPQPEEPVLADPTNCAEAAEAALSVEKNNELYNDGKEYTIEGYVTAIQTPFDATNKNITFWMADAADGGKVLEAYRAACETAEDAPAVGDKVAVTGKLTKYNKTPEFAAGCTFVIKEKSAPAVNLGAKTIAEFLALKNAKDTCVLTGVVDSIANTTFGNLYLVEGTDTLYVYGVLTPAGESKKFETLNVAKGDKLTIKAVYSEYNGAPQAANAIFVSVEKAQGIENIVLTEKVEKVLVDGVIYIVRDGKMFNLQGAQVR